ncbi:MAG TPA: hypothetical protein VK132_10905 [Gemmatimonadales bacterium]|nr:hypothetical protein [Gemmatimonadales bacterium]
MRNAWLLALSSIALAQSPVVADESLVRFEGGIGVIPVSSVAGTQNANGTFPDVNRNDVRGVGPAMQLWVISSLSVDVKVDGRISVDGRGLLLAGGNAIGTAAGQMVQARLFCGTVAHNSGLVALDPNGNFQIDDVLSPTPPDPCSSPVLLIVNAGGRWFAAGIQKLH